MKYEVTFNISGLVTVVVDAEDEKEAKLFADDDLSLRIGSDYYDIRYYECYQIGVNDSFFVRPYEDQ